MSIVIPAANTNDKCYPMLVDLLKSIELGEYTDPTIVCFDNCGHHFVKNILKEFPWIVPIINTGNNHGFAKNANKGIRKSYQEFSQGCFVLNMDTVVPHSSHLLKVCNDGLASPCMVDLNPEREFGKSGDIAEQLNILNYQDPARNLTTKFAGFCMWFSKNLVEKVGYLDEVFVATFEDDDICVRTCLAGLPCEIVDVKVHHYIDNRPASEISTTGAYTQYSMSRAKIQYMMKWDLPEELEHADYNKWILEHNKWNGTMRCKAGDETRKPVEVPLDETGRSLADRLYDVADEVYAMLPPEYREKWLRIEEKHRLGIRSDA